MKKNNAHLKTIIGYGRCNFLFSILFWLLLAAIITGSAVEAQTRKPLRRKSAPEKPNYHLFVTSGVNQVTGPGVEFNLRNRDGALTRSSLSVIAGYSTRYEKFFSNTSVIGRWEWVHGAGIAGIINNYKDVKLSRYYWGLGISGHIFLREKKPLKTFAAFGHGGFKRFISSAAFVDIHLGAGIMGSPLSSSSRSDINGLYLNGGAAIGFALKR